MAAIVGWLWPIKGPSGTAAVEGSWEEAGLALLLALVFLLWALRRLRKRKPEEERRAVTAENRRKARRLYEEAFGAGDFSVIDEVVAEEFFDHLRSEEHTSELQSRQYLVCRLLLEKK